MAEDNFAGSENMRWKMSDLSLEAKADCRQRSRRSGHFRLHYSELETGADLCGSPLEKLEIAITIATYT